MCVCGAAFSSACGPLHGQKFLSQDHLVEPCACAQADAPDVNHIHWAWCSTSTGCLKLSLLFASPCTVRNSDVCPRLTTHHTACGQCGIATLFRQFELSRTVVVLLFFFCKECFSKLLINSIEDQACSFHVCSLTNMKYPGHL